ncbi:MAG: hypothetical protein ACRENP_04220 [Longimicrobiales bacterium]
MEFASRSLLVLMLSAGCSADRAGPNAQPDFSGTYATTVTVRENTCANVTTQNLPTVVQHTAGSNQATLQHGGQTYRATIAADHSFITEPLSVALNGINYRITMTGRFGAGTLQADVRVDASPGTPAACYYIVAWAGTRN